MGEPTIQQVLEAKAVIYHDLQRTKERLAAVEADLAKTREARRLAMAEIQRIRIARVQRHAALVILDREWNEGGISGETDLMLDLYKALGIKPEQKPGFAAKENP